MQPDTDDDLWLIRRRKAKAAARRRRLWGLASLAAFVLIVGVWVAAGVVRNRVKPGDVAGVSRPLIGGPSPTDEGENWTYAELRDYLRSRGVPCRIRPFGGRILLHLGDPGEDHRDAMMIQEARQLYGSTLYVRREPDAEQARQRAGSDPDESFAWGKFVVEGSKHTTKELSTVHQALTGQAFRPRH